MTTESEALAQVLRAAVSDVDTPADFAETALRKGKRRKQRVRASMVGAALAVTAMLGGLLSGVPSWRADSEQLTPASDVRLSRPTTGELAGDAAFLARARTTWERELAAHVEVAASIAPAGCWEAVGRPHVLWASRTGAGPAAVLVQALRAKGSCESPLPKGGLTVIGVFGTDISDGREHLLGVDTGGGGVFLLGPNAVVIAAQESQARYFSPQVEFAPDGTASRRWTELVYQNGIAVSSAAAPDSPWGSASVFVKHKPADPGASMSAQNRVRPVETDLTRARLTGRGGGLPLPGLQWATLQGHLSGPVLSLAERRQRFTDALDHFRFTDPAFREWYTAGRSGATQLGGWDITAALPDGRTVIVSERVIGNDIRSYAALFRVDRAERVVRGSKIDRGAALPVVVRLPDAQGWIVAHQGAALRWRSAGGAWNAVPGDAALLPDLADTVEVVLPGKAPVEVALPR
ncbi:hypothetical protein [Allokutzneria sp. NRRL B-24872]|uniref:hypothetical protein n=1 Tax=Allokutzneria sp. NRRL B-24872 TaxID=1137961 RepID=UPI000A3C8408|nr:hypothetical protein [Allokutzneria sp. NRRL B-24872]